MPPTPADDSYVEIHPDGAAVFVGRDSISLFRAMMLREAINLWLTARVRVNRHFTPTAMLQATSRITGQVYPRRGLPQAHADLNQWILAMQAALPVTDNSRGELPCQ